MIDSIRPRSVKAHILRNTRLKGWEEKISGRWDYRDLASDPDWFKGWISFDTVAFNPYDRMLYCGLNSLDSDLLYSFNPKTEQFESMHSQEWADKFDVKIRPNPPAKPERSMPLLRHLTFA